MKNKALIMIFRSSFCSPCNKKFIPENIVFYFNRKHLVVNTFLWDSIKIRRKIRVIDNNKKQTYTGTLKIRKLLIVFRMIKIRFRFSLVMLKRAIDCLRIKSRFANGPANRFTKTIFRIDCLLYRSQIDEFSFR